MDHTIRAEEFANRIDHNLGLYNPEITYAQLNLLDSHDTPRYLSCVKDDKNALKLAWLFLFTYPGAPCIYYGDEIGLNGGHDPECRKSFPWDESKWDKDLLEYAKACIALRNKHKGLRQGTYKRVYAEGNVVAYAREHDGERIITVINTADAEKTINLPLDKKAKVLLGSPAIKGDQITIPARSGAVIK